MCRKASEDETQKRISLTLDVEKKVLSKYLSIYWLASTNQYGTDETKATLWCYLAAAAHVIGFCNPGQVVTLTFIYSFF